MPSRGKLGDPSKGSGTQSLRGASHKDHAAVVAEKLAEMRRKYPEQTQQDVVKPRDSGEEYTPMPATFSHPGKAKEDWQYKQDIWRSGVLASQAPNSSLTYAFGKEDVEMLRQREREYIDADMDQWISSIMDPRLPQNAAWLEKHFPEYIERRVKALDQQLDFQRRSQLIEGVGVRSRDDLTFLYQKQRGMLPQTSEGLVSQRENGYIPGMLSKRTQLGTHKANPWHKMSERASISGHATTPTQLYDALLTEYNLNVGGSAPPSVASAVPDLIQT